MSDWLAALQGTPDGARIAAGLALMSAFAHAVFGALQKGKVDPWLARGAIDASIAIMAAPVALFIVPWPEPRLWIFLLGAVVVHFIYKCLVALAYERAAYTVVYPVIRGTGPLVTVLFAAAIFSEHFTLLQWLGVACLSGGILILAGLNLQAEQIDRQAMRLGLILAMAGGISVAAYTTWDALGIRAAANPFTFLAWFFFVTALDFPVLAFRRYRAMDPRPPLRPLAIRGISGALIAFLSFGGVMLATFLDKVGEAAVLRETSTVFAALIGWVFLGETVGAKRAGLMALIALGAVIVEFGG